MNAKNHKEEGKIFKVAAGERQLKDENEFFLKPVQFCFS